MLEDLEAAGLHPDKHIGNPGLDAHALVLELCVNRKHREALRLVLLGQGNAGTLERFASTVTRPRPWQILAPRTKCRRMDDGRCLAHAVASAHVDRVSVAVPRKLDRGERMIPTEVHPAD